MTRLIWQYTDVGPAITWLFIIVLLKNLNQNLETSKFLSFVLQKLN